MSKPALILLVLSTLMLVGCEDETITDPGPQTALRDVLLNQESEDAALDYWSCDDPAFPGEVTDFAFFPDNAGLIRDTSQTEETTYVVSDRIVDVSIDGTYRIQLSDFSVAASEQAFDFSYTFVNGAGSGTMSCQLAGVFFDQNIFANATSGDRAADAWECAVGRNIPVKFYLGVNGVGVFFNPVYEGGVVLAWSADAQGLYFELGDGANVIALNARLESLNLVADALTIDGVNAGSMQCELVDV